MTSYLWTRLGLGQGSAKDTTTTSSTATEPSTHRALPASWYRSDHLYQLERRAIFSKRWILLTHKLRFAGEGDWLSFQVAGFPIVVSLHKGEIRAFHNVCRHRGFPVVTEDKGNAKIFSCKYHGWSYGMTGNLAKAPGYQDVKEFDKAENGLLMARVHVDVSGFVWVNLDLSQVSLVAWEDDFDGVDMQERFQDFNFEEYEFDHTWEMKGDFNWKTLADNYNECYHCAVAHPDVVDLADVQAYDVSTAGGHIQHYPFQTPEQKARSGMKFASTYYFPNACMTVSTNFMYMMRCNPISAHHCLMEYEVYRHKDATNEAFEKVDSMFKRILSEDKWLCENVAKNLEAGVFVNGEMHSRMEKGPLYFQSRVREILRAHRSREDQLNQEIWPAQKMVSPEVDAGRSCKDIEFCARLDGRKEMAW